MQSRHAAFALLRRLALRDFIVRPQTLSRWSKSATQPLAPVRPRPFHHCARRFNDEQSSRGSIQNGTREPVQEAMQNSLQSMQDTSVPREAHPPREPQPSYEMTFTCKPCGTRSTHLVSKQGYHFGSVLITCPECKNRHIISDHLGMFLDKAATIEDFMRDKGQLVKKGTLSGDGNLEFWEDDTITSRGRK